MLQTKKQTTINGASVVMEGEKEITIATMFASLTVDGKFNNNATIIDKEKYAQYAEEVDGDIAAFNAEAMKLIKEA